jgi:hypothetical protein
VKVLSHKIHLPLLPRNIIQLEGKRKLGKSIRSLWILRKEGLITKYDSGNQIEKNEVGGTCSTYGGKERCIQDFGGET